MDAKRIVKEAIGDPGEIAKFVQAALPDLHLDSLTTTENDDQSGGWIIRVRGVLGDDGWLGSINWHHFEGEGNLYYVDPDQFIDDFMTSQDWEWKSGAKWVKRAQRSAPVYFPNMKAAKRSLFREPMVQRRIARLTNLTQPAVESLASQGAVRERRLDRVVAMLETDEWTITKSGFHANGRAYVVGTGACQSVHDVVESVDTSADCAHLFVEDIQPARRSDSSPWQIDFTILQDAEEDDTDDLSAEELSSLVLDNIPGILTRKLLREIHLRLKKKLPSTSVTVGHANGLAGEPRKLFVSFGITDRYPTHEPKTEANSVSDVSSLAAVKEVVSELGIQPYGDTPESQFSIKFLHPVAKSGWFIQFAMEGPENYHGMSTNIHPHWTIDESHDVSMFRGVIRRGAEDTPGFKDTQRLYAIKDALESQGFTVHQAWQKPGAFYTPTQARQVDVSVIFSWPEPMAGYKVEEKVIDAFYDKDINYRSSLYFTTIFDRPNTGLVSFYCSSYDEPDKRRSLHFNFTPPEDLELVKECVDGIDIVETWTARDLVRQTDPSHPARVGMAELAHLMSVEGLRGTVGVSSTREPGTIQVQFGLTFVDAELDKAEGYRGHELVPLYAGRWDTTILKAIHKAFDPQGFRYAKRDSHLIEYHEGTANGGKHWALIGRFFVLVPEDLKDLHIRPFVVRTKIGESKEVDDFMQSYLTKWRVGKHEWSSGTVTYYAYRGMGDKAPDDHNRWNGHAGVGFNKSYMNAFAAYLNWLEKSFMPSDRFPKVEAWITAADLAGKMQEWLRMVKAHKAPIPPVEETQSHRDALRATAAVATPLAAARSNLSALAHHLYDLGSRRGRLVLKTTPLSESECWAMLSGNIHPPDNWRSIYHDARPAIQGAVRRFFSEEKWSEIIVSSTPSTDDVSFHCKALIPLKPGMNHGIMLSAVVGKDAEYHRKYVHESMDPAELVSRAIPDIRFHNVMLGIAAELKRCGCKGKVVLSTAGFDAPQPGQAPQQNVEITAVLTDMPGDWYVGRAFKTHFSDIVHEEFRKHPDLPQYKKIAFGSIGSDEEVHIFVEYAVPGLFAYKHPKVYQLEGITPGELYRRSIVGSKLEMMGKMRAVASKLHDLGYKGVIQVRRSQYRPNNAAIFRMFKPQTAMDSDEFKRDIAAVWKDVWGEDVDPGSISVQNMPPVDWMPYHLGLSMVSTMNGFAMQKYAHYGFTMEGMDPAALYRNSLKGSNIEGTLTLRNICAELAKLGYKGSLTIDQTRGGWNSISAVLYDVAGDTELEKIRRDFRYAFATQDKVISGGPIDVQTGRGLDYVRVYCQTWNFPGVIEKFVRGEIQEGMDPGELYRKSIRTSPAASVLLASAVGVALRNKGYPRCRVNVGPLPHGKSSVVVYCTGVPNDDDEVAKNTRLDLKVFIVNAVRESGYPEALFLSSQLFPSHHEPGTALLAVSVQIEGTLKMHTLDLKEGMDPGDLYKQSLKGTHTGAMVLVDNIGQALLAKGYDVELNLQPTSEHWNCLFIRLNNIPLDYNEHEVEDAVTKAILSQDVAMDPMRRMLNFYTQGRNSGYVIVYRYLWNIKGVPAPGGISKVFKPTQEGMDPGELYQKSLQGDVGVTLQMKGIAQAMASKGHAGFLNADAGDYYDSPAYPSSTNLQFVIYGKDHRPTDQETATLKADISSVIAQQGLTAHQEPVAQGYGDGYINHLNASFMVIPVSLNGEPTKPISVQIGDVAGYQGYVPN